MPGGTDRLDHANRSFVSYIDKSREYYAAHGYPLPYTWAYHRDVPFAPLTKPLADCRVGLVTTASKLVAAGEERSAKEPYVAPTHPIPERLFTADLSWDKDATHTDDVGSFLPIAALDAYVAEGRVGSLAPRFYGVPTDYSARRTRERDAPAIVGLALEDEVDVLLLTPL